MINLELHINKENKKVKIKKEVMFNAMLMENIYAIKKIINKLSNNYHISDAFFEIVNGFIDFDKNGNSLYPGLIVRTDFKDYAVLYLEDTNVEEEYMISLVKDYIHDMDEMKMQEININYFEIDKKTFLNALKEK